MIIKNGFKGSVGTGGCLRGHAAKKSGTDYVMADAVDDVIVGVFNSTELEGGIVNITVQGECKVAAGGAFTPGDEVVTDASGRFIALTAGADKSRCGMAAETGVAPEGGDTPALARVILSLFKPRTA